VEIWIIKIKSFKEEIYLKKISENSNENLFLRALKIKQEFPRKAPRKQKPLKRTRRKLNLLKKQKDGKQNLVISLEYHYFLLQNFLSEKLSRTFTRLRLQTKEENLNKFWWKNKLFWEHFLVLELIPSNVEQNLIMFYELSDGKLLIETGFSGD
jgi:hypothetical protein